MEKFEIKIEDGVTSIGSYGLAYCEGLESITIPASVTSIDDHAFYNCTDLTTVTFAENSQCSSIGSEAFAGCTNLTSITIPSSVTSIGSSAFRDCIGLTGITIPDSVTSVGYDAFRGCPAIADVTISDDVTNIGEYEHSDQIVSEAILKETQKIIEQLENVPADKIFILLGDDADGYGWEASTIIKFSDYVSGNFVFPSGQTSWQQPEGTLEYEEEDLPAGHVLLWDAENYGNDEYDISEVKDWFLANRS